MNYCIWHVVCDALAWYDVCTGRGVRTTCVRRAIDVFKTSVYGHGLGVEFIRQVIQGGTLGELEGTKWQQIECYVQAEYARSWSLHVCCERPELVPRGYVRSFSRRPWMILTLSERQSAIIKYVWSAGMVTLSAGGSHLGGSEGRSENIISDGKYGAREMVFVQKSVIQEWERIPN